jgi:hypothetical protein
MTEPRLPAAPTPEMIAAGVRALAPLWDMHTEGEMAEIATAVFSAMIALAPSAAEPSRSRVRVAPYAPDVATRDYVAHFGAHAHSFIMPDGSFGSGGLTLTPVR